MGSTERKPNGAPDLSNLGHSPIVKVSEPWTVDKVLEKIDNAPPAEPTSPLAFFHMLERLKTTKREGWRRFGIDRGESISDHMYRMSLISMFAPPSLRPQLDLPKCMKMCLIHDMAELLVGDITPVDGVPKPEKNRREAATMDYLTTNLLRSVPGGATTGAELRAIWQEYEDSQTLDSQFVHDVDKMELLLQMVEYEKRAGGKVDLGEFAYVSQKMTLPEMKAWGAEVIREREEFWNGQEHIRGQEWNKDTVKEEVKKARDEYYDRR